jgi:hypothetical protein
MHVSSVWRMTKVLRESLQRAAQWRLLGVWLLAALFPALVGTLPIALSLGSLLLHHPDGNLWPAALQAETISELIRYLSEPQYSWAIGVGLASAIFIFLVGSPWLHALVLTQSQSALRLNTRSLFEGAGHRFGKMWRLQWCSLIPLGAASAASGLVLYFTEKHVSKAISETHALTAQRLSAGLVAALMFSAFLVGDVARAILAARPQRRSAFLALVAGFWLMVRCPLRTASVSLFGLLVGAVPAFVFAVIRGQLESRHVALVILFSSLASAALGFGKSARLSAFILLAESDATRREAMRK